MTALNLFHGALIAFILVCLAIVIRDSFFRKDPDLCDDEGCDHFGTDHVCIDNFKWEPTHSPNLWQSRPLIIARGQFDDTRMLESIHRRGVIEKAELEILWAKARKMANQVSEQAYWLPLASMLRRSRGEA